MTKRRKRKLIISIISIILVSFFYFITSYIHPEENNIQERKTIPVTKGETLEVSFIDVGQADSILIENEGHYMLVDAGNNEDGKKLVTYFKEQNINTFDYVVGTHPHEDHIGGLDDIINNFKINNFYMPDVITTTLTFEEVLDALENNNINLTIPKENDSFALGEANIEVLHVGDESESDLNNTSIILKVTYQNISFLLTGDAESKIINELDPSDLKTTALKLGHHGSITSTNETILEKTSPQVAIISAGVNNQYGHPHQEVLNLLQQNNIKTYRTDQDGTIIVTTDGVNLDVKTIKTDTNG